ncbi:hypothetical protein [Tissierella pigra]|uniref:hypothetical protein n=1 Tax=Tissierella pigra TaxID=2607614 RepID=UPI0012B232C2|nr:hypothetical protein [Tissierella pigra]
MMKKLLTILLSCAMLLSFSVTAFATENATHNVPEEIMDTALGGHDYPQIL